MILLRLLLLHGLSVLVGCQTLIMNYTTGLLPQDVYLIDLATLVKNFSNAGVFSPSKCEVISISPEDANVYELVSQDGSKFAGDPGRLTYLKVAASSKLGVFQYKITCTVADKSMSATGAVVIETYAAVKTSHTTDVKVFLPAAAFEEYKYSKQELWYRLTQVKGNNLQGMLEPDPPIPLGQATFYIKRPNIVDMLNNAPTSLTALKLGRAFFLRSCGVGNSNTNLYCMLGLREDNLTAVLFKYEVSRSYWIKSGEKQLAANSSIPIEGCFGWVLDKSNDIVCYFPESELSTTIISYNSNLKLVLEYRITGLRHLSANLLCFRIVKEKITKAVCIDSQYSTLASFSNLFNEATDKFKLRAGDQQLNDVLSKCFIEVSDFFASPFKLDSFGLSCDGKAYFGNFDVKSMEQTKANPLKLTELMVERARTFPKQTTVEDFICSNQHHSIFYSKADSKLVYLSMKKPDQRLSVSMDLGELSSVNQVHCSEAGADFVATTSISENYVSIDGLNKEDLEMQRINKIMKMRTNQSLFLAINARVGLVFDPNANSLMLPGSFMEFNRDGIKQLMLLYHSTYEPQMNSTLKISHPTASAQTKQIQFSYEQGEQYPSIKLKPSKKLPKDLPQINLLDYFDLKGNISTINIESSEHDIKMAYNPIDQTDYARTNNTTMPKMIIGEYVINLQTGQVLNLKPGNPVISNIDLILNQSYLLATLSDSLAVICSDLRNQLQFVVLNKANTVTLSRVFSLSVPVAKDFVLETSAFQEVEAKKSFRLEIPSEPVDGKYQRIVFDMTRSEADGSFEFKDPTYLPSATDRNPMLQDVVSLDNYRLTILHLPDPATNLCLRLLIEGSLLLVAFEYKICSHQVPLNHTFKLRKLTKLNNTDIELDLLASSFSAAEGDSVYDLKMQASLFNEAGPRVPETVEWQLVSSKRWRNLIGGQVLSFIQNGNSTIILARNRIKPDNFVVSFFLREVLLSSWEETVAETGGLSTAKFDGRDCIVSKAVIRCVKLTDPVMELPKTMLTDFHTHLYFHVNRGFSNEIKLPITSILEATKPIQATSTVSIGLIIWILILLLLCAVIFVLVYLLKREIVKKNAEFGTRASDESLTEL